MAIWSSLLVASLLAVAIDDPSPAPPLPETPSPTAPGAGTDVDPAPAPVAETPESVVPDGSTPVHGPFCDCGKPSCVGVRHIQWSRDFFSVGRPGQYIGPETGWTIMVPPFPPPAPASGQPAPAPRPWKGLFFENDFRYLEKPGNTVHNPFDFLKRNHFPSENIVTDFGGEFRWQARFEDNRRLTGEDNEFNLFRERLYLNTWIYDRVRFYGEVYWAGGSKQTVKPVFSDLDHGDVNNLFGELRLLERPDDKGWWSFRYGWHEELLFGNQRLVAPLDWANVRRTFDLIPHLLYRGNDWTIDAFWSRPNIIYPRELNQPEYHQQFFGTYVTYKGRPDRYLDIYYLGFLADSQNKREYNGEVGEYAVHTLGGRWQGREGNWLWETELAYQFGNHTNKEPSREVPRNAGMATGGIGRKFAGAFFKPELWFYFDYASGNDQLNSNSYSTFNQLFPLGHKYFGYMDIVGRQNILDPNVNLRFNMGNRANLSLWFHDFHLASARDALYNGGGTPIRFDPSGRAGRFVGNELDIVLNLYVNPNTDWQFGYCQFWAGRFVEETAKTPDQARDANFFYTQFTFRF